MSTRIEFYERLREHIPQEAARLIAEEMSTERDLTARIDRLATKEDLERLRSSLFRWQLLFFVPLWAGVYGTLVAILVRGV